MSMLLVRLCESDSKKGKFIPSVKKNIKYSLHRNYMVAIEASEASF